MTNSIVPLPSVFDSVVMLTWSHWHNEPRSNRYHYATRFARTLPVFFVNPFGADVTLEKVEGHNITLISTNSDYGPDQTGRITQILRTLGVRRPLVWVYNPYFAPAIDRLRPPLTVYHATEDYLDPIESIKIGADAEVSAAVRRAIFKCDMIVAVSEGVAESYRRYGPYTKPIMVLPNGCDFPFWESTGAANYRAPADGAKVALYQGGINNRLDFRLLIELAQRLPAWQFWFCGRNSDAPGDWGRLRREPNVRYFGALEPEGIAALAKQTRVGLIPFEQNRLVRRSLPLKAYEYIACGLPVVTVPIDALDAKPTLFGFGTNAEEFAATIERLEGSRAEPSALAERLTAARQNSYEVHFAQLARLLDAELKRRGKSETPLNVLVLYDDRSVQIQTVAEHLEAFKRYSKHNVFYMPGTGTLPGGHGATAAMDLSAFDAVILHYSIRLSLPDHLAASLADAMQAYCGHKVLFIQDEYDTTETARRWIERLGFNTVYTSVPDAQRELVYPNSRFPRVEFLPTLTGYVPEEQELDRFALPIAQRTILIGYRGRILPHQYGELGQEKYRIGTEVKRHAQARGLPVDIEVDDSHRIYGLEWYRFLGSVRSTLGTESGANVFDFDGDLARLAAAHRDMPFDEFAAKYLRPREGLVRMNQISPKIFEAIRLRTALVLFEGNYSGVIRANDHYISLNKDFSNINEIFEKLQDISYLEEMTDRAYRDIIESGRYSYRSFVGGVDTHLASQSLGHRGAKIVSVPLVALRESEAPVLLSPTLTTAVIRSDAILGKGLTREQFVELAAELIPPQVRPEMLPSPQVTAELPSQVALVREPRPDTHILRALWRLIPMGARLNLISSLRRLAYHTRSSIILRRTWRFLPERMRHGISRRIGLG